MCSEKYIKNICQWGKKIKNAVIQREKKLALFVLCHLTFKANVNFTNVRCIKVSFHGFGVWSLKIVS